MRLPKPHIDKTVRGFRAELNKSAKDGLIHESFFWCGKYVIHFAVEVKPESGDCFDCHTAVLRELELDEVSHE